MSKTHTRPRNKAVRAADRRQGIRSRKNHRKLVERYQAQPIAPLREPEGLYRP